MISEPAGGHGSGETAIIPMTLHFRHHHAGQHGAVGEVGRGQTAKQARHHDVGQSKPPTNTAHKQQSHVDDALSNPGMGHQGSQHDEKGNGQQRGIE